MTIDRILKIAFAGALFLSTSCAPTRFVQPIPEGHYAATASFGGPLIGFGGLTIPMPLTSLSGAYGATNDLTAFAGLHTTALLFGDIQLDGGAVYRLAQQSGMMPSLSVSPILNLALSTRDGAAELWPELDANISWRYGEGSAALAMSDSTHNWPDGNTIYFGMSNWFELGVQRSDGEAIPHRWIPNLQLGHIFEGEHWQYTLEVKYLAVGIPNLPNVVDYRGIGGNGTFGAYFSLTRKF